MNKLVLENISVLSTNNKSILEIKYLELFSHQKIGIKGPSGAGKSTFLHLITGLIESYEGNVIWGDDNLSFMNSNKKDNFRKNNIGMVFQDFVLFEELTALENVCISSSFFTKKQKEIVKNAKYYLDYFNIKDTSDRSVDSYSGGQRQRIAIARALSTNPNIIIADEPTASLDKENAKLIVNDLCKLSDENTKFLIVVSHDDSLLAKMDKVITIVDGKIQ